MEKMKVELTLKGWPAFWEGGGFEDGAGYSQIVAGKQGEKLRPRFIERKNVEVNGDVAEFAIKNGYHIVIASVMDDEFDIRVYRIVTIEQGIDTITVKEVAVFDGVKWSTPLYKDWDIIEAAKSRALNENTNQIYYGII